MTEAVQKVSVIVSAVDRLTRPVERMNEAVRKLTSKVTAPFKQIGRSVGQLSEAAGVNALIDRVRGLGEAAGDTFGRVRELGAALLALGGIAAGGLFEETIRRTIEAGAELERLKFRLTFLLESPTKAADAAEWIDQFATKTGLADDEVAKAFEKMSLFGLDARRNMMALSDAALATNRQLSDMADGFTAAIAGRPKALAAMLGVIAKIDQKTGRISFDFDAKGVHHHFEALLKDTAAVAAMIRTTLDVKGMTGATEAYGKTWDGLLAKVQAFGGDFFKAIGEAGAFDFAKQQLADLLAWMQKLKADGDLEAWAKRISDTLIAMGTALREWLLAIDWAAIYHGILGFVQSIQGVVEAVGGWKYAIFGLIAILNAGLIVSLIELAKKAWLVGAVLVRVFASISAVIAANPIILILTAIAVAALLIYTYWEPIKAFFLDLWEGIKSIAGAVGDYFADLWDGQPLIDIYR